MTDYFFFLLIVNDTNSSNDGTYGKRPSVLIDINSSRYSSILSEKRSDLIFPH